MKIELSKQELEKFSKLLYKASSIVGDMGCSDVQINLWDDWSLVERAAVAREYQQYNSNGRDYVEGQHGEIFNESVMLYLYSKKVLKGLSTLSKKEIEVFKNILEHSSILIRSNDDVSDELYRYYLRINYES
jgi:hypothetical protein